MRVKSCKNVLTLRAISHNNTKVVKTAPKECAKVIYSKYYKYTEYTKATTIDYIF